MMLNELAEAVPVTVIPSGSDVCIVTHVSTRPFPAAIASATPCVTKMCAESLPAAFGFLYLDRRCVIELQQQRRWEMSPMMSLGDGSEAPEKVMVSTSIGAHLRESSGPQFVTPGQVLLEI
jgi:hypothetical protein